MTQPPADQQNNLPSILDALYNEHERSMRFHQNLSKRPSECAPNTSFETKWAFHAAEKIHAEVEKKTSDRLSSGKNAIRLALLEILEEDFEIDRLVRGITVREQELESMWTSLNKMCLTLEARIQKSAELSGTHVAVYTSGYREDVDMKTAEPNETTMTGPSSNVSTADDISMAELQPPPATTVHLCQVQFAASSSTHDHDVSNTSTPTAIAHEMPPTHSSSHFDYSALSVYTPQQRTPCKKDSTITRMTPNSRSSSRSRSERRG